MYKDMLDTIGLIENSDPEIAKYLDLELSRQQNNLELIASENIVSPAVLAALGTIATNKYAEGYPGRRYYGGCVWVDEIETLARNRACELFGAQHANVQPHSGAQANLAAYAAMLVPGDTVMGMSLACGGHLTHGSPVNASGKLYNFVPYGVDDDGFIDYNELERIAKECAPKLIVAGASAYPRVIDFKRISEIAKSVGALFMVDMAHIAGLVATGLHPSPVPWADVVTTTTHKTLRGPRGGLILCKEEWAKKIDSAVFPNQQGGPLMHTIAAKAVCFKEAMSPDFKQYIAQVVANCKELAQVLLDGGVKLVSGGTDNHLMLVNLIGTPITGKELERALDEVNITVNKNAIPNDPQKPSITSGIRIGAAAVTTRGFKEKEIRIVGKLILDAIFDFENKREDIIAAVKQLTEEFPIYR